MGGQDDMGTEADCPNRATPWDVRHDPGMEGISAAAGRPA
jgi:hypothetical protein